jgi:hypothetical protein
MNGRLGALIEVYDLADAECVDGNAWLARRAAGLAARAETKGVQQWRSIDDPRVAVVTCDVVDAVVAAQPAWTLAETGRAAAPSLRVRYIGEQILPGALAGASQAGGLLLLAMDVDPAVDAEFNDWNDTEHFPRLAAVEGVITARRIRCLPGAQHYLAVYHSSQPEIIDSPAWIHARETAWARRIRTYTSRRMRIVGRRVHGS